jgi:hypothetical protein
MARKYEYDWTRFDGPYLWYQRDQLNGSLAYKATVSFPQGSVVIEAERFVSRRGGVVRARRDPKYDPGKMTSLALGATPPADLLSVELLDLEPVQPMAASHHKMLEYVFYRSEGREFLTYQTSATSSSSFLYPPPEVMAAVEPPRRSEPSPSVAAAPIKSGMATASPSKR